MRYVHQRTFQNESNTKKKEALQIDVREKQIEYRKMLIANFTESIKNRRSDE